jgi:hypothetical protein
MFRILDLFLSSGEGREIATLLGPKERADLNRWVVTEVSPFYLNRQKLSVSHSLPEDGNRFSSRNFVSVCVL